MVHPMLFVVLGGKLAAKVALGHMYGYHRIYRLALRNLNKFENIDKKTVKDVLKKSMRAPREAYDAISSSDATVSFLKTLNSLKIGKW